MKCKFCEKDYWRKEDLEQCEIKGYVLICLNCDKGFIPFTRYDNNRLAFWDVVRRTAKKAKGFSKETAIRVGREYNHEEWTIRSLEQMLINGRLDDDVRDYVKLSLEILRG